MKPKRKKVSTQGEKTKKKKWGKGKKYGNAASWLYSQNLYNVSARDVADRLSRDKTQNRAVCRRVRR